MWPKKAWAGVEMSTKVQIHIKSARRRGGAQDAVFENSESDGLFHVALLQAGLVYLHGMDSVREHCDLCPAE